MGVNNPHVILKNRNETGLLRIIYAKSIREGRFSVLFYSNEHLPIHVHVRHGDGEAVFNLEDGVDPRT